MSFLQRVVDALLPESHIGHEFDRQEESHRQNIHDLEERVKRNPLGMPSAELFDDAMGVEKLNRDNRDRKNQKERGNGSGSDT